MSDDAQKEPTQTDLDQIQLSIERALASYPSIILAILFGSLVRGNTRSDSDLDLAVLADRPLAPQTRIDLVGDLALAFGRPVDLIDLSRTHGPLLRQIMTQGKLILCKDRTQYAELIRRLVYEEADFMPYYRRILAARRKAWIGI
jgi:predicted nucleotidyltransferase